MSDTPGEPDTAVALYVVLGRLVRDLRRSGGGSPVGPSAMSAMVTLGRCVDGLRLGELAEAEGISAPALTRIVHTLDELGLVVRTADPRDRRAQVVVLSVEGRSLLGSGQQTRLTELRARLAGLSDEHRRLLEQAMPALEALVATTPAPVSAGLGITAS